MGRIPLTEESIDAYVAESIGNYALGYSDDGFTVEYVGRSDTNLNDRLKDYLDENFKEFKFSYAEDAKAAYFKECRNYHDFNPRYNDIHPRKPDGQGSLKCPVCGQ
jgi:hypothetical protein